MTYDSMPLFMDSARNASYAELVPKLTKKQQEVYDALVEIGPATLFQVATHLGVPVHCVCGRLTELKSKDRIRIVDYVKNPSSNKTNSVYCIA